MDALKCRLFFVSLCFAGSQTEASSWTVEVPSSVKGLLGSCVVIPCSYNYPGSRRNVFTGIWMTASGQRIYHPEKSKVIQQYSDRTKLVGDVNHNNCSLKIDHLQQNDQGPFHFRIEIQNYDKYSYTKNPVSITVIDEPDPISLTVRNDLVEGQSVSASCSVTHSCPDSPPHFTWNHPGEPHFQPQKLKDGQWKATSTLNFMANRSDHDKSLQCTVTYSGGKNNKKSSVLKIKYRPVNVKVEYQSVVKEGESVRLKCSSDANPASSYEWHDESGARLHEGGVYMLQNVSRHTGALYCTARNTQGQRNSSNVQLRVLYAPEIRNTSSCSLETDTCQCIVDSRPPSTVKFVLSDRVLPNTKKEEHGSLTIWTLQAPLASSKSVVCLANNSQGNTSLTLPLLVNSKMQSLYFAIYIAAGAGGILVLLSIAVAVFKKWGKPGDSPPPHLSTMKTEKNVELPQYAVTSRRPKNFDDRYCPDMNDDDHIYGNVEFDCDDSVYANM